MEQTEALYQSPDYKRSRMAYLLECAFEYFTAILVTDAFLAKVLSYMGLSDSLIGIISTFVTLACVFQLFAMVAAVGKQVAGIEALSPRWSAEPACLRKPTGPSAKNIEGISAFFTA